MVSTAVDHAMDLRTEILFIGKVIYGWSLLCEANHLWLLQRQKVITNLKSKRFAWPNHNNSRDTRLRRWYNWFINVLYNSYTAKTKNIYYFIRCWLIIFNTVINPLPLRFQMYDVGQGRPWDHFQARGELTTKWISIVLIWLNDDCTRLI